jgi:hypothetical protein
MNFFLLAILILLGLLLLLLVTPIDLAFNINRTQQFHGRINVHWLFGLLRFHIDIPGESRKKKPKPAPKPTSVKKTGKQRTGSSQILAILKQSAFRKRLFQFAKDLLHATHSHELALFLRIGLGDPADTGRLWGILGPLGPMLTSIHSLHISIEPEFLEEVFEFRSQGKFRLIPLEFIILAVAFLLSPPSRRAWRILRQNTV